MSRAIQLRVAPSTPSTLRLTVSDGVTRPVEAEIPAGVLDGLAVIAPKTGPILLRGRDTDWTQAEDTASRKIAEALAAGGAAWAHLQVLRGRAEASGQMPTVVVDVSGEIASTVPWELLSLGEAALEGVEGGFVARLGSSGAGRTGTSAPTPTACVWCAGTDPISAALAANLRLRIEATGLSVVAIDQQPSLLWVVAHGELAPDAFEVVTPEGSKGPGAISARLGAAIPSAAAVILAVCHAGSQGLDPLSALSGRLLAAGAGLVVTPITAVPVDAMSRFAEGFLGAVAEGDPLGRCVAAGRRAVRGWTMPQALARWNQLQCWISSVADLEVVLCASHFRPSGWPNPDPEAAAWLDAARRDALRRAEGYLGVEHLLRTLAGRDGGSAIAAAVRRVAPRWLESYDRSASTLTRQRNDDDTLEATPRLAAFGQNLPDNFGMEALAARLGALGRLVPRDAPVLETVDTVEEEGGPATDLEVQGGPEDGRRLTLDKRLLESRQSGLECIIGRAGGNAFVRLYEHTRLTDLKLSRKHLRWEGEGRAFALGLVRIRTAGAQSESSITGPLEISVGDELSLPDGTRLLGVSGGST